ncbi:MAG: chloride channel protein [Gemmatimonadota bacterium]
MDYTASPRGRTISRRLVPITLLAAGLGILGGIVAKALLSLIALVSNLVFRGQLDAHLIPPTTDHLGLLVIIAPVLGALVVGVMARHGSAAIRGHGIPEVMERVLFSESRIGLRVMVFKPLSAAIAIGTGGPFGAEGPIIATGGALGSVLGSRLRITSDERRTLLAAGAAAGMAATFGTPVAAVLLAVELLLFEYRARSIIPVAFAASTATAVRLLIIESGPVFPMAHFPEPSWSALVSYVLIGALIGLASVGITKLVYAAEDLFERLPVHWMWWPAIGAIPVGLIGYFEPRILGVGYDVIRDILLGDMLGWGLLALIVLKFIAWSIYLGSGTSGGTLAPLFIIGGGLGALVGSVAAALWPSLGISVPVAGLVGMAAVFAGASHALLASVIFAFEATREPSGLLPLLAGCSAAYLISILLMRTSIMTEKLARRGTPIPSEYAIDHLALVPVEEAMTREVISVGSDETLDLFRARFEREASYVAHQGFPVLDPTGRLVGVVTRRDLAHAREDAGAATVGSLLTRSPIVTYASNSLRDAADHMIRERVGRLPVVDRETGALLGIITRSDLLAGHERRLRGTEQVDDRR